MPGSLSPVSRAGRRGEPREPRTNRKLWVPALLLLPEDRRLLAGCGVSLPCCLSLKQTSNGGGRGRFPVATSILSRAMPYWGPLLALFCTVTTVLVHQALCTCPSAVGPTLPADRPVFGVLETPRSCTSVRDHRMPFQLSVSGSSGPSLPPLLSNPYSALLLFTRTSFTLISSIHPLIPSFTQVPMKH